MDFNNNSNNSNNNTFSNIDYLEKYTEKVIVKEYNIKNLKVVEREDFVCVEKEYLIYLNNKHIYSTVCSPQHIKEMVVGYLFSQGIISKINSINNILINIEKDNNKIFVYLENIDNKNNDIINNTNKDNKINKKNNNLLLKFSTIKKIINYINNVKGIWSWTGGTHWASIGNLEGDILITIEDIGRHNAIDKVIGYSILNNINLSDKILISSGRTPLHSVLKCVNCNIPVLISKSPTTNKGIALSKNNNLILIGFAKNSRFVVYNGENRILLLNK